MADIPKRPVRASEEENELIPLTPAQQRVYDFVRQQIVAGKGVPSRQAIADALGKGSASGVNAHLKKIQEKGWLRITKGQTHGLQLTLSGDVPLLSVDGSAPLGRSIDPERDIIGRIPGALVERFRPRPDYFLELDMFGMNVEGLAMGEIVAICSRTPEGGNVVIAQLNSWLLCRVYRRVDEQLVDLIDVDRDSGNMVTRVDLKRDTLHIEGVVVGSLLARATHGLRWYREQLPELRGDSV